MKKDFNGSQQMNWALILKRSVKQTGEFGGQSTSFLSAPLQKQLKIHNYRLAKNIDVNCQSNTYRQSYLIDSDRPKIRFSRTSAELSDKGKSSAELNSRLIPTIL